jgi:hypothetical protein
MPLPPGWKGILKHGKTRDYYVYEGPGGKGRADSKLQAWKEYNGDPVYMPQPKPPPSAQIKAPELADPLTRALPAVLDKTTVSASPAKPPQPGKLTSAQVDEIFDNLEKMKRDRVQASKLVHGWTLQFNLRANPSGSHQGDLNIISPSRQQFRSIKKLTEHLRPYAQALPDTKRLPRPGDRVEVFWTEDKQYFAGGIARITSGKKGQELHRLRYDDGQEMWHDLADEKWRYAASSAADVGIATARARAVIGQVCATRLQRRRDAQLAAQSKEQARIACMQTLIWECEYGIWLASNNDEYD